VRKFITFVAICAACGFLGRVHIARANDNGICAASVCADPGNDGVTTASDALNTLRIAVGLEPFEGSCEFTVCEGEHCVEDVLPVASLVGTNNTDEVACFVGPENLE
jgi:hypothetical protein